MNSMNAVAVTSSGISEQNSRNRSLRNLSPAEVHFGLLRKRTSAIESPSDLLLDPKKDELLRITREEEVNSIDIIPEDFYAVQYRNSNTIYRYFYENKRTFKQALELFNRANCHYENGVWRSHGFFFECKGAIRVVQRMCTRCRDADKPKTKTDLYYVDLAEKHRERTVYCHGCMGKVLQQEIGTQATQIEKQLAKIRRQQKSEIHILSRENR